MLYIALLHYPVLNKESQVVTTSIANMDLHDIARASQTYGVRGFYVVNPMPAQRELAAEIMNHWQTGYGAFFNKSRKDAFGLVRLKTSLKETNEEIKAEAGYTARTIVTGANLKNKLLTFAELKKLIRNDNLPYLLIFGTGSGVTEEIINNADHCLEPIKGTGDYNHLAVRSAVAIILDRIMRD
jgi:hypothetical protein